jgi:hypothetical protein
MWRLDNLTKYTLKGFAIDIICLADKVTIYPLRQNNRPFWGNPNQARFALIGHHQDTVSVCFANHTDPCHRLSLTRTVMQEEIPGLKTPFYRLSELYGLWALSEVSFFRGVAAARRIFSGRRPHCSCFLCKRVSNP